MLCWQRLEFTTTMETMWIWGLHAVNISECAASALLTQVIRILLRAWPASSRIAIDV
nr:hypothetical protein Iba_chr12aCG22920 [Ipomoea batatas]GME10339.1 hypothetical protein Iba_scaffold9920CG0200 [Ipomoea batatas]